MGAPPRLRELLIVGAGGFARETAQAVLALNAVRPSWRLRGFLDDDPTLTGRRIDGIPVLGPGVLVHAYPHAQVVLCMGSPRDYFARMRVARRLDLPTRRFATVVHPSVDVSPSSTIGPGSVLLAQSALTASVRVGAHVAVMPRVVLTHDVVVGDFATLASGVSLGGGARLETGAYLGAGALVREQVTVGAWSLVGMGSVVLRDIPPAQVWVGNPARQLRPAAEPADLVQLLEPEPEYVGRRGE